MENKKTGIIRYFVKYAIAFALSFFCAYLLFFIHRKGFVVSGDGENQHFKALLYYARWLRTIAHNIFVEHRFDIPMYSFGMGYGSDIITTLSYYVIGDPLTIFSAFVTDAYMSWFYALLVVCRLFLAGVMFSFYCISKKRDYSDMAILSGAMMYVFCSYVIHAASIHPYFTTPMIYFPLMLIGIDRIIKDNRHGLFIVVTALSCVSNFYFFYMEVIFVIIYAIAEVMTRDCGNKLIRFLLMLRDGIISAMLAAPLLLPTVIQIVSDPRASMDYKLIPIYFLDYYKFLLGQIATSFTKGYWTFPGTTFMALLVILYLIVNVKKYQKYKLWLLAAVVAYAVPFAGYFLNGMSYVSNRWDWAFVFLVSFMTTDLFAGLLDMDAVMIRKMWIATGVYAAITGVLFFQRWERYRNDVYIGNAFLIVVLAIITFENVKKLSRRTFSVAAIGVLSLLSFAIHGFYSLDGSGDAYLSRYIEFSQDMVKRSVNTEAKLMRDLDSDVGTYRISGDFEDNITMLWGVPSTNFYFSLSNPYVSSFLGELGRSITSVYHYSGLDGRTMLNALTGVKYVVNEKPGNLPEGAEVYYKSDDEKTTIYCFEDALPFIYGYDEILDSDVYAGLSPVGKQEALMEAAVISETDDKLKTNVTGNVELTGTKVDADISLKGDIEWNKETGEIKVFGEGGTINLNFAGLGDSETYVCLDGLYYDIPRDGMSDIDVFLNTMETEYVKVSVKSYIGDTVFSKKKFTTSDPTFKWANGIHDFAINGGYSKQGLTGFELKFTDTGTYKVDDIYVICQKLDNFKKLREKRVEGISADITCEDGNEAFAIDGITADITLDKSKLVLVSIPYASGWSAYVDGKKTKLYRANTMFMALQMDQGAHELRLIYRTPGAFAGMIFLIIGVVLFWGVMRYHRKAD